MADDWALERALELWESRDAVQQIAAELRKERERFRCAEDQTDFMCAEADDWEARAKAAEERAAALEAALRETRDDLAVTIAPPIKRQDTAIDRIDAALRDHGGALADHDREVRKAALGEAYIVAMQEQLDERCTLMQRLRKLAGEETPASDLPDHDRDKQIIEALKALLVETCEHLEALVKVTREGMREPAKERK